MNAGSSIGDETYKHVDLLLNKSSQRGNQCFPEGADHVAISPSGRTFGPGSSWVSEHFDNFNFMMMLILSFFLEDWGGKNSVVFKW